MNQPLLRYTGHPLVDAGTAGITAYLGHRQPEEVTPEELERWSTQLLNWYASPAATTAIVILFTTNFPWTSPILSKEEQKRRTQEILFAWRDGPVGTRPCTYCGRPALTGGAAAPYEGRAQRDLIPLLEGREKMNFSPGGRSGLYVCGACIAALQALTMAAPVVSGKAVVADTPDPDLRLALADRFVRHQVGQVAASVATAGKVAVQGTAVQWVVDTLVEIFAEEGTQAAIPGAAPVTVYWLSNSGQGPSVAVRAMTEPLVRWIRLAQTPQYRTGWLLLRRRGEVRGRNFFAQDVGGLPEGLERFVRRYGGTYTNDLLVEPEAGAGPPPGETPVIQLLGTLLREVVGMRPERVDAIRTLSRRLAEEVEREGPRLGRDLFRRNVRGYQAVRDVLIRANGRRLSRGDDPLIGLEGFITVFDEGPDEVPRADWRLAWDLITLGTAEQLYASGWFARHRQEVAVEEEPEQGEEEEESSWDS